MSEPISETTQPPSLDELRREIDAIDADMHGLLIRRGEIIDRLIATKKTREAGAFRPDREADMMRRMVERHRGHLPLTTVEHIWREIISTFTQLQSGYTVHLDAAGDTVAMVDMARFYFGFAVPVAEADDAEDAIDAVAQSPCDLALVRLTAGAKPWWRSLGPRAQVMARLPFIRLDKRQAATPALVVSRPLDNVRPFDIVMLVADGVRGEVSPLVDEAGAEIVLATSGAGRAMSALLAVPQGESATLMDALIAKGIATHVAGGYFSPIVAHDRES